MSNRSFTTLKSVVGESIGLPSGDRGGYLSGLALNEEIDAVNRRPYWFLKTIVDFALTTSAKTYVLSTSWPNLKTHIRSVLLDTSETVAERDLDYLTQEDFFVTQQRGASGPPAYLTIDPLADLIRIDSTPGSGLNGRKIRTLYFRKIARLSIGTSTLGVDDSAEDLVVQGAMWRAMQRARLDGWQEQKRVAEEVRREMLATPESTDFASLGFF